MEGILAVIAIFIVMPSLFFDYLKSKHKARVKELELTANANPKALQAATAANVELEQRVRHLEGIVTSVDFELNAKLNRLTSLSLQMARPAALRSGNPLSNADTEPLAGILQPAQRIANRYVVERPLGQGGMGAVYLARDEELGEPVALKVIAGLAVLDPAAAQRFRREASAARRISSPHVVRLHDIGDADGMLFLSMEYVQGPSVRDLIARHGALPAAQVQRIAAQMCEGLAAAHDVGVIHRDLKPANVLLDGSQRVKIIDFGLAHLPHLEGMTATNMIIGTAEYMAPEQIRGGTIDGRTDIYALGALLYHMLTGRPPFVGDTPIAVGFAHCSHAAAAPSHVRPELGDAWDALVHRALAKDPQERFQAVLELRDALPRV